MTLYEQVMEAMRRGVALAGSVVLVGAAACSTDKPKVEQGEGQGAASGAPAPVVEQVVVEAADAGTPDLGTADLAVAAEGDEVARVECGEVLGELPSEAHPANREGRAQRGLSTRPPAGRYLVCAPRQGDSCAPVSELTGPQRQRHVERAMNSEGHCPLSLRLRRDEESCGPVARDEGSCCYVFDLQALPCPTRGRPFVISTLARVAGVSRVEGWCAWSDASLGASLSQEEREEVAAAWAQSGLHEHASVASFGKFMMELLSYGAPSELVQATAQAIQDEIEHAKLCFSVASAYVGFELGPDELDISHSVVGKPTIEDMIVALIREGCVGETLSAYVEGARASWIRDERVADATRRLAEEEERHAALAWSSLAWLLTHHPQHLDLARSTFADAAERTPRRPVGLDVTQRELLAHGVLPEFLEAQLRAQAYQSIVAEAAHELFGVTRMDEVSGALERGGEFS
jgi:hypothetical protein